MSEIDGQPAPQDGDRALGTVHFDGGEVSGVGACNGYGALYSAQHGGFVGNGFNVAELSSTEMYCGDTLHPFEMQMFDVLIGAQHWVVEEGGQLVIQSAEGEMVLLPMLTAGG